MLGEDQILEFFSRLGEGEEGEDEGHGEGEPEQGIGAAVKAILEREKRGVEAAGTGDVVHPEEDPAHHHDKESGKWRVENGKLSTFHFNSLRFVEGFAVPFST